MNHRERVLATVAFQPVDALPLQHAYGLMPGVLEDWYAQGLPPEVQTDEQIRAYFGFPPRPRGLPVHLGLHPAFPTRVLEDTPAHRVETDALGRTVRLVKGVASIPLPLDYPVHDRTTWEPYRERLQFSADRVGDGLEDAVSGNVRTGGLSSLIFSGFYWMPRDLLGDEGLCIAYYEQPALVEEMLETWCRLIEECLEAVLSRVTLDEVRVNEDMAYRNASIVGPRIFDRFLRPYYERVAALVRRYQVPIFSVDTDGSLAELAGWFQQCGVNLVGPNEVQAGNDLLAYRERFGQSLAFEGGLDKRVLTQGREAIEAMLQRLIPPMKESGGGWVMSLDHRVLPGTPLEDFRYFVERVRELALF